MSQDDDFKQLERKAYLSYHQDGLLDIAFGLGILGIGLIFLTDWSVGFFLSWMPFVLYLPLKKAITIPRLGYAEFKNEPVQNAGLFGLGLVILLLVVIGGIFIFGALSLSGGIPASLEGSIDQYVWMSVSGIVALIFVGAILAYKIARLVIYAALTAVMVIAGFLVDANPALFLIALGGFIFIIGLIMLVRFLRKNPVVNGGENHAV